MQAAGHHIVVAIVLWIDGDFGIFHLIVLTHGIDEYLVLHLGGHSLRDDNGIAVVARHDDGARTATLQQPFGVGEAGYHRHRTGGGIDHATYLGHLAGMLIGGTIGEQQLHWRIGTDGCMGAAGRLGEVEYVFLGHGEIHFHRGYIRNGGQCIDTTCAHECSHLVGQAAHHTVGRTLHIAEAERLLCGGQSGFSLCHGCHGRLVGVLRRL